MKKLMLCAATYLFMFLPYVKVKADVVMVAPTIGVNNQIAAKYNQINFGSCEKLDYEVFDKAYRGYVNLYNAGKLNTDKQILTICDFSKSSSKYRLWILDLKTNEVLVNDYVAHGQGSGDEFAMAFSNQENSHQSSLGFYVTGEVYMGDHGRSLRLNGMDNGFNNAAYDRSIVVHGADYVNPSFVASQHRLGRSWGCPAVSNKVIGKVINTIQDKTCLFIYYPQKKYLQTAYWLNKKIDHMPGDNSYSNLAFAAPMKRDTVIVYEQNGLQQELAKQYSPLSLPLL
ncbi:MAG: murein L,D-transpeptidase catalytic domain family protein [Sphingobacteriales bacterium]|nr:MAG: murein L,D-transpeptidase catalytic domain family protein [Sphingobacteriales bacterium]